MHLVSSEVTRWELLQWTFSRSFRGSGRSNSTRIVVASPGLTESRRRSTTSQCESERTCSRVCARPHPKSRPATARPAGGRLRTVRMSHRCIRSSCYTGLTASAIRPERRLPAMVGIVVVSHSAGIAEGIVELAREMGGDVDLSAAGGTDQPDALGTDATKVVAAIEAVDSGDGVLVLMDLGSAVLSAEMARDMLPAELQDRVMLCEAPVVEGAVSAAMAAKLGRPLA